MPVRKQQPVEIRRLSQLCPQTVLWAHCKNCAHNRELKIKALIRWKGDRLINSLPEKLRCTTCGTLGAAITNGWSPSDNPVKYPSRRQL